MAYKIKMQSTNDNDSLEEAVIAMRNIKTVDGKVLDRTTQAKALMALLVKFGHFEELNITAPSWQGLSDDEIFELSIREFTKYDFARAIEQALKEKNYEQTD